MQIAKNFFLKPAFIAIIFTTTYCANHSNNNLNTTPSWYVSPKQNDAQNIYGIAEGDTLEEATKYSLADAAARLMVSISSESNLIREENQAGTNEEMRQQVKQNIEKINFTNFKISKSEKLGQKFFIEVQINRDSFINEQKENLSFLEKQIDDLAKNIEKSQTNLVQKRNSLIKIIDLSKQVDLKARILFGAGENINLKEKLTRFANFQNQLNNSSDKIEFYFDIKSSKEITQIIRNALNKEKIKIASAPNKSSNQIVIKVVSKSRTSEIYGAYITKLEVDFANLSGTSVIASNSVEVSGSSTISEKESYLASIKSLEERISQNGILNIIGLSQK